MSKVKVKKQSTFIDMTAMSDVTVLLLTFFMLTSTFIGKEPIQVTTPSSVSEIKIPESNLLTILVDKEGKLFLSLDFQQEQVIETLRSVGNDYGYTFTPKQEDSFKKLKSFGVPIATMGTFLDMPTEKQDEYMRDIANPRVGIPTDSVAVKDDAGKEVSKDNEFKRWVRYATQIRDDARKYDSDLPELQLAIKADKETNYPVIKKVMDDLRSPELRKNRYLLITNLKTASSD
ncbi:biopolymer transporter ExbD [Bacteroidia bacterium]|nr:biopolymer transporter ExbD [Bacteroidia bacterium]GHT47899.1 biopolymer transporter ExbD [Bacteroidia bacterium]